MCWKIPANHKNYASRVIKLDLLFKYLLIYFKLSLFYVVQDRDTMTIGQL